LRWLAAATAATELLASCLLPSKPGGFSLPIKTCGVLIRLMTISSPS
jgi:hypothetical protein